jgi:monovalent cation:H+ antiporter-2, CPA2 family
MIVTGLVTVIFHLFKQPVALGYLLASVIIGAHTTPDAIQHEMHSSI